jgi:drug/metabolite transporter (DMT)-like permease
MPDFNLIYPILAAASFSISSVIIRNLKQLGPPAYLNLFRTGIGAVLFVVHLFIINKPDQLLEISLLVLFYLFLSVIFNVVIGDTLYFSSQNVIGVKIATPIVNTFPLLTVVIAVIWLDESFSWSFILGGIIIIIGITILSLDMDEDENKIQYAQTEKTRALLFAFAALICYALGVTYTTIATEDLNPVVANSVRLPFGAISLGFLMIAQQNKSNTNEESVVLRSNSKKKILWFQMLVAGILGTYLASLFLVLSVQKVGAGKTAILAATGPFFALPIAILWLKENAGKYTISATLLTVVGLWIILGF